MRRLKQKVFLILILVVALSYNNCSNHSDRYSMEQIQFERKLNLLFDQNIFEFSFTSEITTKRFLIDLFFPSIYFERFNSDNIKDSILKSLDGLEMAIVDLTENRLILKKEINYFRDGHRNNDFLEGKILSLNLAARLQINGGHLYSIKLFRKIENTSKEIIKDAILIGGLPSMVLP